MNAAYREAWLTAARLEVAYHSLTFECDLLGVVPPSRETVLEECRRDPSLTPVEVVDAIRTRNLLERPLR